MPDILINFISQIKDLFLDFIGFLEVVERLWYVLLVEELHGNPEVDML